MKTGREKFHKYRKLIALIVKWYRLFPRHIRYKKLERVRYRKGTIGLVKRYALVKSIAKSVGDNVGIDEGVFLYHIDELVIGDNVSILPLCYIDAWGGLTIGSNVSIAHGTSILTFEHGYTDKETPIKYQPIDALSVTIRDNVWIGAKATILGGHCIGTGCVVGAGSVITKDVSDNSVVVGVPGHKIKDR